MPHDELPRPGVRGGGGKGSAGDQTNRKKVDHRIILSESIMWSIVVTDPPSHPWNSFLNLHLPSPLQCKLMLSSVRVLAYLTDFNNLKRCTDMQKEQKTCQPLENYKNV